MGGMSKTVARLYESFQPNHYDLSWTLDTTKGQALGHVTISGRKTGRPSQRISLHGKGLTISKATITKHDKKSGRTDIALDRVNLQKSLDEIRLHSAELLYPGDYTIELDFVASIQASMHGIYSSSYKLDGQDKVLISTQFESHHAREAFPCVDEPEAKATFDVTLVTSNDLTAISNMPIKQQTMADGLQTTVFETSPKMSTYLLAFAVGEMQQRSVKTKDGVDVSVYATKAHQPEALDFALDTTKRCIEFFNDYYGVPYPLPKCDMVAIPDFSSAAMENWGLVTYREPFLLADPATASHSSRELIALVVCHELSHQWFGNLVTMKWWDDLWLNESFANVMEYVAVDALFPDWHIFNTFIAQEGLSAFRRDSIAGVQSIKTEVKHPDQISTLFDPSIVYAKGGRLLNMLRVHIGDEAFRAGLTKYFEKHQYGNTIGDDLWAALSASSGQDVAAFMDPWLKQSGFPLLTVEQTGKDLKVSQRHFLLNPEKADAQRRWPVPLLAENDNVPGVLDKSTATVSLSANDFVRLNHGAVGHYIVHYADQPQRQWLAKQVANRSLSEAERLMLLSDSSMLARNGVDNLASTLQLLEHYSQEDSEPVWDMIALAIGDARRFIDADPDLEDAIKALIRQLIEPQFQRLGWQPQAGESSQDTKLRGTILGLGAYAEHTAIKAEAVAQFATYKQDSSKVDSELRGIVFSNAVRDDLEGAFDYLLNLEETTTNPDLKHELLSALSVSRKPERGQQLLSRLKDIKKVRLHDVDSWLVLLMRNRHSQQLAWDWLRQNWQWIETTFAGDKSFDVFPRYAASAFNTRQRLEEYREFFAPMTDQILLERNITMGIEELESRIAWVERDLPALRDYFKA